MENPPIIWAQDRDTVYFTVEILNISKHTITLGKDTINFQVNNDTMEYTFSIDLHSSIIENTGEWSVKPTGIKFTLQKETSRFWNRLTKTKQNNIKIDWQRWIQEDESESSDEDRELLNNFQDFKKTLPSELLEKDFSELLPEDTNLDDGFEANDEETTAGEEDNNEESNINSLDISRLEDDLEDEFINDSDIKSESEGEENHDVEELNLEDTE